MNSVTIFAHPDSRKAWRARDTWLVSPIIVFALVLAVSHGVARAACEEQPAVCGKRAFEAGIAAFQKERYEEALSYFREAQEHRPHPIVLFNVALAEAKTGHIVEAVAHLDAVFEDPSTPEQLLGKVRTERDAMRKLLARIELDDEGGELYVDGELVTGDPPKAAVNPGEHQVRVIADDEVVIERTLSLSPGEKVRLALGPVRPTTPVEPTTPTTPTSAGSSDAPPEEPRSLGRGWVFGGAGLTLVLAGVSTWSGFDTRRAFREFEDDVDDLSEEERSDRVDKGRAKQRRTNVLVGATAVVGVATAATGLFFVDWSQHQRTTRLTIGPGRVQLQYRF